MIADIRDKSDLWAIVREHQGRAPDAPFALPGRRPLPCVHEGAVLEFCPSCAGRGAEGRHVRDCDLHERCTRDSFGGVHRACSLCPDYEPDAPAWDRTGPLRIDHTTLFPSLPGKRFNAALIAWNGGYAFAWRDGWAGSDIWLCQLDRHLRPVGGAVRPDLTHFEANYGREDPQLFVFGGELHVAYVGVQGLRTGLKTNVLYARLRADFSAAAIFAPKAPGVHAGQWQKNWQWFESGGGLYAIYTVAPHRVLRIDGGRAEWAAETPYPHHWTGGEPRGGATPCRVGDEYWSFFHDSIELSGRKRYRVGLYTFDAAPPFRVRRFVPYPVIAADVNVPHDNYCDVIFPRGAVRDGPDWLLSCGVHDRWAEIVPLRHADLERQLVSL